MYWHQFKKPNAQSCNVWIRVPVDWEIWCSHWYGPSTDPPWHDPESKHINKTEAKLCYADPGCKTCFASSTGRVGCLPAKHISNHDCWRHF